VKTVRVGAFLGAFLLWAACGGEKKGAGAPGAEPAAPPTVASPTVLPVPVLPAPPAHTATQRTRLHLSLRSTPAGAATSIDGRLVGTTPVRWEMDDDGRQHEFSFTLPGYVPWRLKFSPSQDGVVHASMQAVPYVADAGAGQ